jgi:hypothetical protein
MNEVRVTLKGLKKARVNHVDFAFLVEVGGPIRQNTRKTPADRSKSIAAADFPRENRAEESRWDTRAKRRSGSYGLLDEEFTSASDRRGVRDLSSLNDWEAIAKTESAGTV